MFVVDDEGRKFQVPIQCAELEPIYFIEGKWRREQHPLVVQWFREQIAELEATRDSWPSGIERVKEQFLEKARRVVAASEASNPLAARDLGSDEAKGEHGRAD